MLWVQVTSTPAENPDKYGKRKRNSTGGGRRTRQQAKMSEEESSVPQSGAAGHGDDVMTKMAKQLAAINSTIDGFQDNIRTSVAEAIGPLNDRIDSTNRRLEKLENRRAVDMAELQMRIGEQIEDRISGTPTTNC